MKKYIIFLLPIFLYATSFNDLIKSVDNNLLVKSKQEQTKALKKMLKAKKAKNSPFIDLQLNATRLYDTPMAGGFGPNLLTIGTKTNLDASLGITYPLFTGYAITKSIQKAKLEFIKSKLETKELKRKLYLKIASLYSAIYSSNKALIASNDAKKAIEDSYKKAKGLYANGLINISNLYKIEAQKYEILSTIQSYKEQKNSYINDLIYLTKKRTDVKSLPYINISTNINLLQNRALNNRADINALKIQLKIDKKDIALAKSKRYPQIALFGAIKRQGDNLNLNGNGFTNADQSYIGATLKYNIFDGGEKRSERQASRAKRNATVLYFADYKRAVIKNIKNAILRLDSLNFRLKTSMKQVEASKSYYKLTSGRFDNSIASGDELSRAIANLATKRAKKQNIKAKIFLQICKINLLVGSDYFMKSISNTK